MPRQSKRLEALCSRSQITRSLQKYFYQCPQNEVLDWIDGKQDKKFELLPDGAFTVTSYVEKEPYILYFVFEIHDTAFVLKLDFKYIERKESA